MRHLTNKRDKKERIFFIRKKLIRKNANLYKNPLLHLQKLCFRCEVDDEGTFDDLLDRIVRKKHKKIQDSFYLKFESGSKYWGQVLNSYISGYIIRVPHGYGVKISKNKDRYDGYFYDGFQEGKGILYKTNGEIIYGNWYRSKLDGYVEIKKKNKILFQGTYVNGVKEGYGEEKSDIRRYSGDYLNDVPHGYGKMIYGKNIYTGNMKNGKKDGIGTIRIFTGKFEYHYYYQGKKYRGPLYRFPIYEEKKGFWKEDKFIVDFYIKKGELMIQNYLNSMNEKDIKYCKSNNIRNYIYKNFHSRLKKNLSKKELVSILYEKYHTKKLENIEDQYDLFGNEIKIPVKGSDDYIYDKNSLEYFFEKDESERYKRIPYIYENNISIPKFPIMGNGKTLYYYWIDGEKKN